MSQISHQARRALWLVAAVVAFSLRGNPAAARTPTDRPCRTRLRTRVDPKIPAGLGQPLVDFPQELKRLDPASPAWIDKKNRQIVLIGSSCKANYPLEFFATYPDRGYESVVVIYTKPSLVHAGLLVLGAKPGKPVQYKPKFVPASGTEVAIDVAWKGGWKTPKMPAQQWIRDVKTKKPLEVNWVFAGSLFWA